MSSLVDQILTLPQHIIPQHLASRLVQRLAKVEQTALKEFLIKVFLSAYDINLAEAQSSSISDYKHFNDFFTRRLKPGMRPLPTDDLTVCSPADGQISQYGSLNDAQLIQAKGRTFNLNSFLAAPGHEVSRYENGHFATIYLAPNDYHRVHVPFNGKIVSAKFVPGKLFSVNQRTARTVDQLFARNERVVIELETAEFGRMAVVLVGALLVASIGLEFFDMEAAIYTSNNEGSPGHVELAMNLNIEPAKSSLCRGEGLGWFNMGSTVIMVFEENHFSFNPALSIGQKIQMGQALGTVK